MNSATTNDVIFRILHFLNEKQFKGALHKLERESRCFFNLSYFSELVLNGKWNKAEKYICCFTKINDNVLSEYIFCGIRKQKYLEALDEGDVNRAHTIFVELDEIISKNRDASKEFFLLLNNDNFRKYRENSMYTNKQAAREELVQSLQLAVKANPLLRNKLSNPEFGVSSLQNKVSQGFNGQHSNCTFLSPQGDQRTVNSILPVAVNMVVQPIAVHPAALPQPVSSMQRIPGALTNSMSYATTAGLSSVNSGPGTHQLQRVHEELPKTVVRTLDQGSSVLCMDFSPKFPTLLLVGTLVGDIGLWDVRFAQVIQRSFQLWNVKSLSEKLMSAFRIDPSVSVCRVRWNDMGTLFGVAYSKHIVQIYFYHGGDKVTQYKEIDAHDGSVNDIRFASNSFITCGADKKIKVWETSTSPPQLLTILEGHTEPVTSLCLHVSNQTQFLLSTSLDEKIKVWQYNQSKAVFTFNAPGRHCTTMAYKADVSRLFSCGTKINGENYLVEWEWEEGREKIKRTYDGLFKHFGGNVHFDINKNRILAVGEQYRVKFWDMDNKSLLDFCIAEGGLPCAPPVNFNVGGNLLAVSTVDNKIKVLATRDGMKLLHTIQDFAATRPATNAVAKNGERNDSEGMNTELCERHKNTKKRKVTEIHSVIPFRCSTLDATDENKVARLMFNHSGDVIIVLLRSGGHRYWRCEQTDTNVEGKVTIGYHPCKWKSIAGLLVNGRSYTQTGEDSHYFTLSNDGSSILSTSGGPLSIFNVGEWEAFSVVLAQPFVVTCVEFNRQDNNLFAVGMTNSIIQMYDLRSHKLIAEFSGHSSKITGLTFSCELNTLVSAAANAEIIMWSLATGKRQNSTYLQIPNARVRARLSDTEVQFHLDQKHVLAIHETQLALYETTKLIRVQQWRRSADKSILVHTTFSADSELIYACFQDGLLGIFSTSTFGLQRVIHPTAYLPESLRNRVYPTAITSNPKDVNQFAVGFSDGLIMMFEPPEAEDEWGNDDIGASRNKALATDHAGQSNAPAASDHAGPSSVIFLD